MNPFNLRLLSLIILILILTISLAATGAAPEEKSIKFNHGLHVVDAELSCEDCHSGISELSVGGMAIPDHDVCSNCHDLDDETNCGMCHLDPEDPTAITATGGFYAGFGHNAHGSLDCNSCHGSFSAETVHPSLPGMNDCQTCHHQSNGPLSCEVCHLGQRPQPTDHKFASWHLDHGLEANTGTSDCQACHEQSTCDECHQGINLTGSPHPPTWQFNHFTAVTMGGECMTCHETRQFCNDCHKSRGAPHPLGIAFANKVEGGSHKEEAEAFMESCLSCHDIGEDDPTCAKCHD